jgi:hypothetical protein
MVLVLNHMNSVHVHLLLRPILILSRFRVLLRDLQDGFWIVWLDLLTPYTQYSELQAIQRYRWSTHFTVHPCARTRVLSLHQSYPGNGFITVSLSLQITYGVLFSKPNSFLAIILQLTIPNTRLNSIPLLPSSYPGRLASRNSTLHFTLCCWTLIYNHFARSTLKTQPILLRGCFLIRCLAIDILWLSALALLGMCLPSRCLAVGIHVAIPSSRIYPCLPSSLSLSDFCSNFVCWRRNYISKYYWDIFQASDG